MTESAYAEHTPAFSFLNWALFVFMWWKWQQKWKSPLIPASPSKIDEVLSYTHPHFIMPTLWEGKLRLPGLSSQDITECPLWFSGGIPASRQVFLPICHSYSLFRFEESFVTTKLSILISFHFKVLMMQLIRFFIFSDMWCFQAKKILIQPFGHLFDVWSLLALLGVCAHWSVTAWEGLGVRILFPANS